MRPKKPETTGEGDLFRAKLDLAPLYSDKGRPGIETCFVIGLLLLKHIYGLSDEGVCER
jgi:IS5 family transposase